MFEYFEPNPNLKVYKKGKKKGEVEHVGDCVIRAFAKAWECSWKDAAIKLFNHALDVYRYPSDQESYTFFLQKSLESHFTYDGERKRYLKVKEFAKLTKEQTGLTYIVRCLHHLVCVKEGKYYDCWDSGNETVRNIYLIKEKL